jgi:uncharacterized protein (TIGR02145 family)
MKKLIRIVGVFLLVFLIHSCKKDDKNALKDIDGNVYTSVTSGTQVWMVENLKTTKYNDGTPIPLVTDNTAWTNLTTPGYCWYNNDAAANKNTYGALYNWYAVNTDKLCPTGWHVPSDAEWHTLVLYLDGNASIDNIPESSIAGDKLKEEGTSHWMSPNTGTNSSGFKALPGGGRNSLGFGSIGGSGLYWSSTGIAGYEYVLYRGLGYNTSDIFRSTYSKWIGCSVRCLKD